MLRESAGEALLDTVTGERRAPERLDHRLRCPAGARAVRVRTNPEKAAERDRTVRAAGPPPDIGLPPLQGDALRVEDPLRWAPRSPRAASRSTAALRCSTTTLGTGSRSLRATVRGSRAWRAPTAPCCRRSTWASCASMSLRTSTAEPSSGSTVTASTPSWFVPDLYVFGGAAGPAELHRSSTTCASSCACRSRRAPRADRARSCGSCPATLSAARRPRSAATEEGALYWLVVPAADRAAGLRRARIASRSPTFWLRRSASGS